MTLDDLHRAADALAGVIEYTPLTHSRTLSDITGATVHLKFENLQYTGSFKGRGARNRLLAVAPGRGVIAMSAGNHAQGVAHHGALLGLPTTIVMPENTPFVKVARTRDLGAEVVLAGADVMESAVRAGELAEERDLEFIHPFDDPVVIARQGTVGLEMLAQEPELDMIVAAVGGGGLAAGLAVAAAGHPRPVEVVGVQTERYPSMADRLAGRRVGLVLCGGNIDPRTLSVVAVRGLAVQGRLNRIRVELDDTPGRLALVSAVIAREAANVVEVGHDGLGSSGARSTILELRIDTLDADHADRVLAALRAEGLSAELVDW